MGGADAQEALKATKAAAGEKKESLGRNHKTELKSDEKATQKEPKNNCRMPKTYEYQTLLVLFVLQGG